MTAPVSAFLLNLQHTINSCPPGGKLRYSILALETPL
jgi:hypothetical protein